MAHGDPEIGWRERLSEMEAQLRALAAELADEVGDEDVGSDEPEPEPVRPPPPPPPPPSPPASPPMTVARDPTLEAMSARLVASMRELLSGYELALTHVSTRPAAPAVTLAAGPFASVAVLEHFERALLSLPGVSGVTVRGYEGSDRAVLEVHLEQRVS